MQCLDIAVEKVPEAECEVVGVIRYALVHEIEEAGVLPSEETPEAEIRVQLMPGVVGYYCDVVGIVLIQRDSHLEVAVHSLVRDIRTPGQQPPADHYRHPSVR